MFMKIFPRFFGHVFSLVCLEVQKFLNWFYFQWIDVKDITLTTVCWKTPIFQSKQPMTKSYISLNNQFTVVLNDICFSVRFCDLVFSFPNKNVQGFSSDRKMLTFLFHLQNRASVFLILILSQDILGNVHYVREINLIS